MAMTRMKQKEQHRAEGQEFTSLLDPLDKLDNLHTIFVRQPCRAREVLIEMLCPGMVSNKFDVGYSDSPNPSKPNFIPLFYFEEESDCLARFCCKSARPLTFKALREKGNDSSLLFTIDRPFRMGVCCLDPRRGCLGMGYLRVLTAEGALMGDILLIRDSCASCSLGYAFSVCDARGAEICKLERRNCCVFSCCGKDVAFAITINDVDTGKVVAKTWSGVLKELFTDYDNFRVEVPNQFQHSRYKKLLLVATSMLLDLKFFEKDG